MSSVKRKERRVYRPITEDDKSKVLRVIAQSQRDEGRPPTLRKIADSIGRTNGTVQRIMRILEDEKRLINKGGARAAFIPAKVAQHILRSVSASTDAASQHLPILGYAAAGQPIEAVDSDPEMFPVPSEWCRGACYLLRIRGDSMTGDGIQDGDLVLVESTDQVQAGAIHVCWIPGDGATIKRVRTRADVAELVASNENFTPITAPHGTIVQGRVVWVLRSLGPKKRRRRT